MIQLTNITKSFGGQTLFNGLNLQMQKGQKIGLIGRNGTGKSTLFKIILGEESYDSGDISIPQKLPNRYTASAFGIYQTNGTRRVCTSA